MHIRHCTLKYIIYIIKNVLIGSLKLFGIFHSDANINMMWHASDMILAWYNYIIDSNDSCIYNLMSVLFMIFWYFPLVTALITMITSLWICRQGNQAAHPTCHVIVPGAIVATLWVFSSILHKYHTVLNYCLFWCNNLKCFQNFNTQNLKRLRCSCKPCKFALISVDTTVTLSKYWLHM